MFGIIYFFVALFFLGLCASYLKELRLLNTLRGYERAFKTIPIFNFGKHISAFTIENFDIIQGSATIKLSGFRTIFFFFNNLFFKRVKSLEHLKEIAGRLAIARMRQSAKKADYIVNLKLRFKKFGKYGIQAHAYGTALFMYEDTLPLFNLVDHYKPTRRARRTTIISNVIFSTLILTIFIMMISALNTQASKFLMDNLSIEDEYILWSYIRDKALENRSTSQEIAEVEDRLNSILRKMPASPVFTRYSPRIYVIDEPDVDIITYPAGNIAIYKNLLYKVKSEDVMTYIIAHELAHMEERDYLKDLGGNIVNLYILFRIFGADSFVGRFIANPNYFWNQQYADDEEINADKQALITLDKIYGHIGGYNEFRNTFSSVTEEYQDYLFRHPVDSKIILSIEDFISSQHFLSKDTEKTIFLKLQAAPVKLSPGTATLTDDFMNIFGKYQTTISGMMNEYKAYIANFQGILNLPVGITKDDLQTRYESSLQVIRYIDIFSTKFSANVEASNKEISNYLEKEKDDKRRRLLSNLWLSEKNKITLEAKFYFSRDTDIFSAQGAILNFLIKRYGNFTVTKYGIQFTSNTARDQYMQMLARIEEMLRKHPPQ